LNKNKIVCQEGWEGWEFEFREHWTEGGRSPHSVFDQCLEEKAMKEPW